jgi:hypothetical protein
MMGRTDTGDFVFDPEVLVMTLCTGLSTGLVLVLLHVFIARDLMALLFIAVTALMVLMEGTWLNFWYRPARKTRTMPASS